MKIQQKIYGFLDNLIWIGSVKFTILLREYSRSAVNVLSSSSKISDLIKNNFFQFNLARDDEKIESKYSSADF